MFQPNDQIVLLSTCSYEMDGFRTVIAARKVREGEDTTVDTSKAVWNPTVLYPDGWYSAKGGTKPQHLATFEEALAQGKINWISRRMINIEKRHANGSMPLLFCAVKRRTEQV